jgi:MFS family permease
MSDHAARPAGSILPVHAHPPHPPAFDPRRWWALVLLCLAQFMVILDITVVNVALPTIGADLHLDRTALTWVVTAYTLCFGGLMLLGGRLADTLGRRRMFLAGLGLFTAASLASGLTQTGTFLVAARAGQGVGAALLSPAALAIITTTFHGPNATAPLGSGRRSRVPVPRSGCWPAACWSSTPVGAGCSSSTCRSASPSPPPSPSWSPSSARPTPPAGWTSRVR